MQRSPGTNPWYRQLWPWLVFLPPAAAVIGGFTTLYLAISHPEHEVCGDYVRDGFGTYPKNGQGEPSQSADCN